MSTDKEFNLEEFNLIADLLYQYRLAYIVNSIKEQDECIENIKCIFEKVNESENPPGESLQQAIAYVRSDEKMAYLFS